MQSNVISLEQKIRESSNEDFHAYRLKFNSLFLAEDYKSAFELTTNIMQTENMIDLYGSELAGNLLILGYPDHAMKCLDHLLEKDPIDKQILSQKLKLLKNMSAEDAYPALLNQCLSRFPQEKEFYLMLLECYNDSGKTDLAQELIQQAELKGIELNQPKQIADTFVDADYRQEPAYEDPLFIDSFLSMFGGRENVHARQWASPKGSAGYNPVSEPLNPALIRGHLMGLYTLGVYQLNLRNRVKWIVFDIDVAKDHIIDMHDHQFKAWIDDGFRKILNSIRDLLKVYQLEALYEFSGHKGYHVWLFFEEEVSASLAKGIAQKLAAQFELGSYPLALEIFPKQTRLTQSGLGNLVKLPGGIHKLSGLRSSFVSLHQNEIVPIPVTEALRSASYINAEKLMDLVHSLQPDFTQSGKADTHILPQINTAQSTDILCDDPLHDPQWLWLKERCHIISSICDNVRTTRVLSVSEKKVITYTLGLLQAGPSIVNAILRMSSDVQASELLKSQLKGNPMSCNKIRSSLGLAGNPGLCGCDFSALHAAYDSPLLHLESYKQVSKYSISDCSSILRDLVSQYLDIRKKLRQSSNALNKTESQIFALFEEIGVSEFNTGFGVLRIISDESEKRLILDLGATNNGNLQ